MNCNNSKYLTTLKDSELKNWKRCTNYKPFALSFNNNFKTLTGGILHYDQRSKQNQSTTGNLVSYSIPYEISKEDYEKIIEAAADEIENFVEKANLENPIQ